MRSGSPPTAVTTPTYHSENSHPPECELSLSVQRGEKSHPPK